MRSVAKEQNQMELMDNGFFHDFLRDKRFRLGILSQLDREWVREPLQSLVRVSDSWSYKKIIPVSEQ